MTYLTPPRNADILTSNDITGIREEILNAILQKEYQCSLKKVSRFCSISVYPYLWIKD